MDYVFRPTGATGSDFASFLLGLANSGSFAYPSNANNVYPYWAWFVQDDIRVNSKLTINVGLRYELPLSKREPDGQNSNFDPTALNPGAGNLPGALIFAGDGPGRTGRKSLLQYRFIQLCNGGGNGSWDSHVDMNAHAPRCRSVDKPIAGLIKDLKQRGMLDSTLVVFSSEFGRTPWSQNTTGRDHNPKGYTVWLAGGGIKGGMTHGETDEFGYAAVENRH